MFFRPNPDWESWGITEKAHKFFIIRWYEIFSEDTLDSWQVRFSNVCTILKELQDCIKIVKKVHAYHVNISHLIDEGIHIARQDIIIKKFFPFLPNSFEKLKDCYNSKVKNQTKNDLIYFEKMVNVILGKIETYDDLVCNEVIKILSEPPEHYKKDIYELTMSLGVVMTEVAPIGWTGQRHC